MNKGGNVSGEILEKYGITRGDIRDWGKIQLGVLNLLNINEATLGKEEWLELIKLRPELIDSQ
jgi:hypothetical protein